MPYIATQQSQKEVTHNDALNALDYLVQPSVIDHTLATPPSSPSTGDSYVIASSPTGAWSGYANGVAAWYAGWIIKMPETGWTVYTRSTNRVLYYTGSGWSTLSTPLMETTTTWNPGSISTSSGTTSSAVTMTGAALGDFVLVSASYDLSGIQATAYVSAANTVKIRLNNLTGSSVTLGSGTWRIRVMKA